MPEYAILSHRWRADEVTFLDMPSRHVRQKKGFAKIAASCKIALAQDISYVWIDTCCIDKSSSAELSEAINSMYRWYSQAIACYAYLDDVSSMDDFDKSEWFTRGWTLQELIAPRTVILYNNMWQLIGTKESLRRRIAAITGIDREVLKGVHPASCTAAQRMAWAAGRTTTRIEDTAYSLMGLFGVNMPLLYGEGEKAFVRLQEEIIKHSDDHSIFAWSSKKAGYRGLLATSPASFSGCNDIVQPEDPLHEYRKYLKGYSMTNKGLSIQLPFLLHPRARDTYIAVLNCARKAAPKDRLGIFLEYTYLPTDPDCARVMVDGEDVVAVSKTPHMKPLEIFVPQHDPILYPVPFKLHGFVVGSIKVSLKQGGWSDQFTIHSRNQPWALDSKRTMEIPKSSFGTVGTIEFKDASTRLKAVKLGFDSNFNPVCLLYERDKAPGIPVDHKSTEPDWINEAVDRHPGSAKVGAYRVIHERGTWYFGIPVRKGDDLTGGKKQDDGKYHFSQEATAVHPGIKNFPLNIRIRKLDLSLAVFRGMYNNIIVWIVEISDYENEKAT